MRILFVEDNDTVRALICELLTEAGQEVIDCRCAEEAEAAFDRLDFDVVLTDINLPTLSGTELARRLMSKRPELWVVFTSGTTFEHGLEKWGPRVRLMAKPFDDDDLGRLFAEISTAGTSNN